jgi:CBS domain containing-hemolysin-like protein
MGRVPEVGASLDTDSHTFLIRAADERRISQVEIVRHEPLRVSA